jgi:hypothetical protein
MSSSCDARAHDVRLGRLRGDARNLSGHANARSAGATVETNNTTVAANGSPVTLVADS